MTKNNKIQKRVFIILLVCLSLAGLTYIAYLFVFKSKFTPIPLPSGSQIRNPIFLAVPKEETSENEELYIPVLSEFIKSFKDLDFQEHKQNNEKYHSISPLRTRLEVIPRFRTTDTGSVINKNIDVGTISLKKISLGELGTLSIKFGGQRNIELKDLREVSLIIGDPNFISQLADINKEKEHRIYFIDRIFTGDLEQTAKAGISAALNNEESNLADFESKFINDYQGFRLVLGCEFQLLKSSVFSQNEFSGTTQEHIARDLESVLGIPRNKAIALSREPVKWLRSGNKIQIVFQPPFGGELDKQRIQVLSGSRGQPDNLKSNFIDLELVPRVYNISYIQFSGTRAYYLRNIITVNEDFSVEIDDNQYYWAAISWEKFNVPEEYKFRNEATTEENLQRIDSWRKELFQDALRQSSPLNTNSKNSQDLANLVTTAPVRDLQNELEEKFSSDTELTRDQQLRKNLAQYWLDYLKDNKLPPQDEVEKYRSNRQEYSEIKWMQANHILKSDPNSDQLVEVAELFREAAKLFLNEDPSISEQLITEQLNDQALVAYIKSATLEANESATKLQAAEEYLKVALEDEQTAEDIKNTMFEALKDLVDKGLIDISTTFKVAREPRNTAEDILNIVNIILETVQKRGENPEDVLNIILASTQEHGKASKDFMINAINSIIAALDHQKNAQDINDKAWDLFIDSNRSSRDWLDWLGNPDPLSDTPNLWQQTVYRNPDGVDFKVTGQNTGYVEANNGSIQVSTLVNVKLPEYKYLAWDWKAIELPPKGDLRNDETDDQAIQLVVTFQLPDGNVKALDYVWDTNAPIGIDHERNVGFPGFQRELSYLVVESGTEYQNQWRPVRRNLIEDFQKVFPDLPLPSRVKSVTVQTNSWRTNTKSAGEVGQIRFTKDPLSEEVKLY